MADLLYRDLGPQDVDALHKIVNDWEVTRQLGSWPWPADRAFTASRSRPYDGSGFIWGVWQDDLLLGTIGVTDGALGYCLGRSHWGQGIATAIARHAITHAFQDLQLAKITAVIWDDNARSDRVLTKLGFSQLGEQIEHALARDAPTRSLNYVLTRTCWHGLRSRREWTNAASEPQKAANP